MRIVGFKQWAIAAFLAVATTLLGTCGPMLPGQEDPPADRRALRRTPVVEVFQRCKDSVAYLTGPKVGGDRPTTEEFFQVPEAQQEETSIGSAFVIHPAGYLITNAHAVEKVVSHKVTFPDGSTYPAELIASIWDEDLALLKADAPRPLPAVTLAEAGDLMIGETVVVIANPHGLTYTCTAGVLSAVGRTTQPSDMPGVTLKDLIQTDAGINPGSSGGPWFNVLGEAIGVTTSIKPDSQNIGFAVPAATIRRCLPGMLDVERRYGVATGLEVAVSGGCRVTEVAPDSPAAKAGLKPGDVITQLNNEPMATGLDYHFALIGRKPGDELALRLKRGDEELTVSLALAARPKPDGRKLLADLLGLECEPLTEEKADEMLLRVHRGVTITGVKEGFYDDVDDPPKPGDVLARIGKIRPRDLDHAGLLLDRLTPGDPVNLVVLRKGKNRLTRIDIKIPAGKRPPKASKSPA